MTAIWLVNVDNIIIRNVTVQHVQGCHGTFVSGDVNAPLSATDPSDTVDYQNNYILKSERSPFRFYTTRDAVVAYNRAKDCGLASHANKVNFYEQCSLILCWGNSWENCGGYATWQETSSIFWLFNHIPATKDSEVNTSRSLQDQGNGTLAPNDYDGDPHQSYVVCNALIPGPIATTGSASNGLAITKDNVPGSAMFYNVLNNLYNGNAVTDMGQISSWLNNWNTGAGGAIDPSDTQTTAAAVWTDPGNGDFSIRAGAAFRSATGTSIATLIDTIIIPRFGDRFTRHDRDLAGATFAKASPPVGCLVDPDGYALLVP